VSFPGHFLVGICNPQNSDQQLPEQPVSFIDPFAARVVSRKQCLKLLDSLYQGQVEHNENYFAPAGNDVILLRLIENIKAIYLKQGAAERALTCLDYQLLISAENSNLLNQQQQLLAHIRKQGGASSVVH